MKLWMKERLKTTSRGCNEKVPAVGDEMLLLYVNGLKSSDEKAVTAKQELWVATTTTCEAMRSARYMFLVSVGTSRIQLHVSSST
jgi:hypothetical protein